MSEDQSGRGYDEAEVIGAKPIPAAGMTRYINQTYEKRLSMAMAEEAEKGQAVRHAAAGSTARDHLAEQAAHRMAAMGAGSLTQAQAEQCERRLAASGYGRALPGALDQEIIRQTPGLVQEIIEEIWWPCPKLVDPKSKTGRAVAYAKQVRELGEAIAADILNRAFNSGTMESRDIRPLTEKERAFNDIKRAAAQVPVVSTVKPAPNGIGETKAPDRAGRLPRFF